MNKINYQKWLEHKIEELVKEDKAPTLLLHSCCAPCSTHVIDYLSNYFNITVFYYNPNIDELEEYNRRAKEQQRLIEEMPTKYKVNFLLGNYDVEAFTKKALSLAHEPEGGARCMMCYGMRLGETAKMAAARGDEYFTTTLSISPFKNAQKLNEIGSMLEKKYGCNYLFSDFKKKEGYKHSVELAKAYNLYRQDYCGCSYSKRNME